MTSHVATWRPASLSDEKPIEDQLKGKKTAAAAGTSVTSKEEKDEEIPVLCNAAAFASFPGRLVLISDLAGGYQGEWSISKDICAA